MFTRKRIIIAVIIIAVLAPVAWWLLSPIFISTTVDEDFPLAANAVVPADMTMEEAEQIMIEAASEINMYDEQAPPEMAMPSEPMKMDEASVQAFKTGDFRDGDSYHKGSGTATIYLAPDGKAVLRLEDFSVTNGPDLRVLLVPASEPQGRDDIRGYLELGKLKGNMGNQNYFLPDGENGEEYGSVVIFCYPFKVVFSVATLS